MTNLANKKQIEAAKGLIRAQAREKAIRKVVEEYQTAILKEMNVVEEIKHRGSKAITEPKDSWLMSDENFKIYDDKCQQAAKAHGFTVQSEGNCPLLEAESAVREAKDNLVKIMTSDLSIKDLTYDNLTRNLKVYEKFVDTTMQYLGQYC